MRLEYGAQYSHASILKENAVVGVIQFHWIQGEGPGRRIRAWRRGFEFDDHRFERLIGEILFRFPEAIEVGNLSRLSRNFLLGLARRGDPLMGAGQKDHYRLGLFVQRYTFARAQLQAQDANPPILDFQVIILGSDVDRVLSSRASGAKGRQQAKA